MVDLSWVNPVLSLPSQLEREMDRRRAARATHEELNILVDKLLLDWYRHEAVISAAAKRIANLELQLMLAQADAQLQVPGKNEPEPRHLQWAQELLSRL